MPDERPARCASVSPDGLRCGDDAGHPGDHTALFPTNARWKQHAPPPSGPQIVAFREPDGDDALYVVEPSGPPHGECALCAPYGGERACVVAGRCVRRAMRAIVEGGPQGTEVPRNKVGDGTLVGDAAAALWWALDLLDMYDARLATIDPPGRVYSATHVAAKVKARDALARLHESADAERPVATAPEASRSDAALRALVDAPSADDFAELLADYGAAVRLAAFAEADGEGDEAECARQEEVWARRTAGRAYDALLAAVERLSREAIASREDLSASRDELERSEASERAWIAGFEQANAMLREARSAKAAAEAERDALRAERAERAAP